MPLLTDGRPLALVASASFNTAYDALSVVTWALLLCLVARCSKGSLTRDLFGVVIAVAAMNPS
jgi:hypothetical protein